MEWATCQVSAFRDPVFTLHFLQILQVIITQLTKNWRWKKSLSLAYLTMIPLQMVHSMPLTIFIIFLIDQ